ncbi:Ricin-type beta-trefoil lectin domain-containing protein [Candidatus Methanophagaceae archaeon]|nr:Ricin-type beta-trefoil lectin domain-containing protein [Methanophagales archaeon]
MEEDEGAYILATDIEGNTTNSEIAKPESPYVPPLADGDYVITAKHSSKSLTVNGNSTANRANVIQDSYWGDAHQRWKLRYVGDGYYEITAKFSCQCLEVADSRTDDGVNVRQNECKDEGNLTMSNQKWQLEDVGDGYYKILNNNSDKCLDVLWSETEDFANVGQYNYSGGDNQKWVFQPVDSYPPTMASYFAITAKELGKCLAVSNNNCVVEKYAGNDTQRMELIPVGDGYFSIIARNSSGKCLSADDGANVILRTYEGNDSQRWKVESIGGSYYKICAKNNYKCLAVNVSNVEQQEYEGKDSHRWKFETKELVTLYELTDYGGKSKRYQGVVKVPYVGEEFDNKASSLKVPAGYTVILYQYKDYRGWMKRFDSDTSDLVGDFNDNTSALVMMKKGDVPTGKIWFYEGNHATQDLVCTVSTTSDKTCQLTGGGDDCDCDNDEARSAELRWVKPGTIIKVYDDPDGDIGDDWTEIKVKMLFTSKVIGTFEHSYANDYVEVTYHTHNGLDGKVSRIKIEAP